MIRFLLGVALCGLYVPPPMLAQTPKKEVSYNDKEKAKGLAKDGVAAFNAKRYEAALSAFKEAYSRNPEAKYLPPIVQCASFLSRPEEALKYGLLFLESAEADNPNRSEVGRLVSDAKPGAVKKAQEAYRSKRYEEALSLYLMLQEYSASPEQLYQIAKCHQELQHKREAIDALQEYIKTAPASAPDRREAEAALAALQPLAATSTPTKTTTPEKKQRLDPLFFASGGALALASASGLAALGSHRQLLDASNIAAVGDLNDELAQEIARLRRRQTITAISADALLVSALALGGAAVFRSKRARSTALLISPSGVQLSLSLQGSK